MGLRFAVRSPMIRALSRLALVAKQDTTPNCELPNANPNLASVELLSVVGS